MSDDAQFVCAACNADYEGDSEGVMTSCRKCAKLHCEECLDEFGNCGACADKGAS